ncbi:chitin synthase chs-2-like [Mytilus californianus]|uniref:chitin synthase chs-2-like n=1 Tax=Mytilus californianus TaxID=6549 RepID=UPI0022459BB8|nr:chitin synthase chs-2-like [Mytilus californianus]
MMEEKPDGKRKTRPRISNLAVLDRIKTENGENSTNKEDYKEYDVKESLCPRPERILKIGFAIFLCIVAFGSGFIGRMTLHILIWHISPPVESTISAINTLGGLLEPNCSICTNETACMRNTNSTAVDESWIWALFLVIIAPYCLTFISTSFRIFFKSNKALNSKVLLVLILIETLHSVGLSILGFIVLPALDPASASVVYLAAGVGLPMIDFFDKVVNKLDRKSSEITKKQNDIKPDTETKNQQPTNGTDLEKQNQKSTNGMETEIQNKKSPVETKTESQNQKSTNGTDNQQNTIESETKNPQNTNVNDTSNDHINDVDSRKITAEKAVESTCKFSFCDETSTLSFTLPFVGFALQIAGIILITLYIKIGSMNVLFVLSVILISIKYWENFITMGTESSIFLRQLKRELHIGRTKTSCLVSLWKMLVTFLAVIAIFTSRGTDSMGALKAIFNNGITTINTVFGEQRVGYNPICQTQVPFLATIICITCEYLCYKTSKTVCVINCQRFGFSFPLVMLQIAVPFVIGGLMHHPDIMKLDSCDLLFSDWCIKENGRLVENCMELIIAFVVLYISILLITRHAWQSNGRKNGETARIFISPFYCGLFPELSLLLNRRRDDDEYDIVHCNKKPDEKQNKRKKLYACCATMWHETGTEMKQLLTSILRLDRKQCINKFLKEEIKEDVETFDLEAHVFFDDAFKPEKDNKKEVNIYVKTFINVLSEASSRVYDQQMEPSEGLMYKTPYGARIEWILPGENKLFVHLKDNEKIRNKKRWSQVMYMMYILKWKMLKEHGNEGIQEAAENTFLLALDGDVDFQPDAVLSLMRRLEKNDKVGAACGRIHPIGKGPMVWYQQFEYAISHWLQKATEHVIGCVLCSPGCFSLFRGSAILNHDVLETYTTIAEEARHCLQYDQGEDRWLCTLLLQKGWKIEYCAESDSYTFAPETFNEFFNQRRRWTPSTMANILEIIQDWQNVTESNENISFLYIVYQVLLFVSTILTPGTVFMIILGALIVGFETIPPWLALILNLLPVIVFILMCLYASTQRQLQMAAILSCIYVIVMVVVMIGVVRDAILEGLCSTTTIFIIFVAGVFVISACLHPKEFLCLIPGLLYFLAIPSMSMLMFLYSLGNLHVTSWGTRETKTESVDKENPRQKPEKEETGYFCSLGKFVSCLFCPSNDYTKDEFLYSNLVKEMKRIVHKDEDTENSGPESAATNKTSSVNNEMQENLKTDETTVRVSTDVDTDKDEIGTGKAEKDTIMNGKKKSKIDKSAKRTNLEEMYCLSVDKSLQNINKDESKFWKKLIRKYLQPFDKKEPYIQEREKRLAGELVDLRNSVCLFVYLLNAILVTVMFGLTQVNAFKNSLTAGFSCGGKDISVVPIAILFSAVFGILLLIQFLCMLYHRFSTLVHITANTDLRSTEDEHIAEIMQKIADLATKRIKEKQEVLSDKSRKGVDMKRSVLKIEEKQYINFKDMMNKNKEKLKSIQGSLYLKHQSTKEKIKEKWQLFLKEPKLKGIAEQAIEAVKMQNKVSPESTNESPKSNINDEVGSYSNV